MLYWVIDAEACLAEVWPPDARFPEYERAQLVWHPEGVARPFGLDLVDLFCPI